MYYEDEDYVREMEFNEDYYPSVYCDSDNDYERDTFYALTGGMYGDYDDFRKNSGDMGYLMDMLGY